MPTHLSQCLIYGQVASLRLEAQVYQAIPVAGGGGGISADGRVPNFQLFGWNCRFIATVMMTQQWLSMLEC